VQRRAGNDWPTIILHVERIAVEMKRLGKVLHDLGDMIERIRKYLGTGRIAVTEAWIIRSDEMVVRRQARQQRFVHARR
jgi:hypothetical protein